MNVPEEICNINSHIENAGWPHKKKLYEEAFIKATSNIDKEKKLDVSIIIISWRSEPSLIYALKAAKNQKNITSQLIFVNNGAGNDLEWCRSYADTYVDLKHNTGAYFARNIGAIFAQANILIFLEDDGVSDKLLAYNHFKTHESMPHIFCTRGICLPLNPSKLNEKQTHYYFGSDVFPYFPNLEGNSAFKKTAFMSLDGWDDHIKFGHGGLDIANRQLRKDDDLNKLIYIPHAILYHDYAKNDNHLIVKKDKQAISMAYLKEKDPAIETTRKKFQENYEKPAIKNTLKRDINRTKKRVKDRLKKNNLNGISELNLKDSNDIKRLKKLSNSYNIYALGAGSLGLKFAEFCERKKIKIECFFDREKLEPKLAGVEIRKKLEHKKNSIIIITTSQVESAINDLEKDSKFKRKLFFKQ